MSQLMTYVPVQLPPMPDYREIFKNEMDKLINQKEFLDSEIDNLQAKIDASRERHEAILEKRYNSIFTALERAKNNYIRFSLSLQTLKDSIDKSPQMQQLLADLHNYHNYSQALTTHIEQIQGQIEEQQNKCKSLKRVIELKHKGLNQQNSKNLALLRQINALRHNMKKQKKSGEVTQRSKSYSRFKSQTQLGLRREERTADGPTLEQLKLENRNLQSQITAYRNNQYLKVELFKESMELYKRQLEKQERKVSDSGLQNSLLFEIKRAQFFSTLVPAGASSSQGRQVRNIVHETLKKMVIDKQTKKLNLDELDLQWEIFKEFNSKQVFALLCLKTKVLSEFQQRFINEVLRN